MTRLSTFVKFATLPTVPTCIVDCNGGTTDFHRISYDPTNKFVGETAHAGGVTTLHLCPGFSITPGTWYWVSIVNCVRGIWEDLGLQGQVWGPGGVTPGVQDGVTFIGQTSAYITSGVGWGVALTAYNNFPNTAGNEMAELVVETNNGGPASGVPPLSPPSAPLSPAYTPPTFWIVALYHANDPVGANQIIHDATSNAYDMAVGPQGNVIAIDSPF